MKHKHFSTTSKVISISLGKPVLHFAEISNDLMYKFENLFNNLKIIDSNTQKEDLLNFYKIFNHKLLNLILIILKIILVQSIIENLNSSLHDK